MSRRSRRAWRALVQSGFVCLALLASCDGGKPEDGEEETPETNLRIGALMVETGHRFETSGRAAVAGRWGMARYEASEIVELFTDDMPHALLPGECNDELADTFYFGIMNERMPALVAAAEREDIEAYGTAFAAASQQCNGCHTTCGVPFVEVPSAPGLEVPALGDTHAPTVPPATEEPAGDAPPAEHPHVGHEVLNPWGSREDPDELRVPPPRGGSGENEVNDPWQ
ncbi:MAG: hypothetical protein AB7S26_32850 [Sandaracinaceae bacterium]